MSATKLFRYFLETMYPGFVFTWVSYSINEIDSKNEKDLITTYNLAFYFIDPELNNKFHLGYTVKDIGMFFEKIKSELDHYILTGDIIRE